MHWKKSVAYSRGELIVHDYDIIFDINWKKGHGLWHYGDYNDGIWLVDQ